jgi:hypothetical protein
MSGFPLMNVPPVDVKTGRWTREWVLFFQAMWERQGGTSDLTDAESTGLTRSRRGTASQPTDEVVQRVQHEVHRDERVPARHTAPRLVLTKEAYKPRTLIRLYVGLTADIPAGWQLADGTNGTPNMRDLFVVGAGNLYASGTTGGSTTIGANNLPTHTHPYNDANTTYTANTVVVQSGAGTTVVQSLTTGGGDTARTSGNNTTTAQPFVPPYYAAAYIINISTVTVVTDAKLR